MTIQFTNGDGGPRVDSRRATGSAVRSHKSYERPARQICHHSGQYLTIEENNPQRIVGLREQHDFPAFKALDDRFQPAAHAREEQHLIWSRPGVQAAGLLIGAALLLVGVWLVWTRSDQWVGVAEGALVFGAMIAAGLGALAMLATGIWMLAARNSIYHRGAKGERPATDDFPLFGAYRVEINEQYQLDLANSQRALAAPGAATGAVTVEVIPEPEAPATYRAYREIYGAHRGAGVGAYLHAGAVALEGLQTVTFDPPIDYDHRLILRQPVEQQFAVAGEPSRSPVRFHAPYRVSADALCTGQDARQGRSVLSFAPRLADFDSYTLQLTFRWDGPPVECALEECRLQIPPELGSVLQVELGRRSEIAGQTEVIWRNLLLEQGALTLAVRFSEPLLGPNAPTAITGSYRLVIGGQVSGLHVPPENVWEPTGQAALARTRPSVSGTSVIEGALTAHVAILAQEHEHVSITRLATSAEPASGLVSQITSVLTRMGVDIQRIEEALPRLDPLGTLNHQLRYWDIVGRKYELAALESVDVHIVVSGSTRGTRPSPSATTVDVRVRCLHDPRGPTIAREAENVCKLLADVLKEELPPAEEAPLEASVNGGKLER